MIPFTVNEIRRPESAADQDKRLHASSGWGDNPERVSLADIAAKAGVGVATAYRYFSSHDELLEDVLLSEVEKLAEHSKSLSLEGHALFLAVLDRWIEIVLEHGPVLVMLRSRRGFSARLREGDPVISTVFRAWERPLGELLAELGRLPEESARAAMFLNVLVDPREVLELHTVFGMSDKDIARTLYLTFIAGVVPWLQSLPQNSHGAEKSPKQA